MPPYTRRKTIASITIVKDLKIPFTATMRLSGTVDALSGGIFDHIDYNS